MLPAFCRVAATLKPTSDSDIKIEVWMPASGWNGKFQAVGNGAFSGAIAYPAMATALARGYATGSTDTGHDGGSASFALGHPEKVIDFGWRAVHEMTVAAKAIIAAYYGSGPKYSLLERLLGRRTSGDEGGAALPGGLRRHHRRRAGPRLDRARGAGGARRARRCEKNEAARLPPSRSTNCCTGRCVDACDALDGVKDGADRGSDAVQVRSGRPAVQGRRATADVPDRGAGRDRAADLLAA